MDSFKFSYGAWRGATVTVKARDIAEARSKAAVELDRRYEKAGLEPPVAWTLAHLSTTPATEKIADAAETMLGISKPQIAAMHRKVDQLEQENDYIGLTSVRHAISQRLVEIRLLLRDGHTKNLGKAFSYKKAV